VLVVLKPNAIADYCKKGNKSTFYKNCCKGISSTSKHALKHIDRFCDISEVTSSQTEAITHVMA
jgi:hypothetical protein